MDTTERFSYAVSYRSVPGWENKFATNIHGIIAPSRGGVDYPHLHRVFRERAAEGAVYGELSRCPCEMNIPFQEPVRTDSGTYQNLKPGHDDEDGKKLDNHQYALMSMCPEIHKRFMIYGYIGGGSMFPYNLCFSLSFRTLIHDC